jgi:hypothetical protein
VAAPTDRNLLAREIAQFDSAQHLWRQRGKLGGKLTGQELRFLHSESLEPHMIKSQRKL